MSATARTSYFRPALSREGRAGSQAGPLPPLKGRGLARTPAAMLRPLLILRPEPGATHTAAAARALGLATTAASMFAVHPVAWQPPAAAQHDALLLTSANAVRHAGPALAALATLPAYAVGQATAAAAREAGLTVAHVGASDAASLLAEMSAAGIARPLHLAGREHHAAVLAGVTVTRRIVYASEAVTTLPAAAARALDADAIALLHSPRAASLFASLLDRPRAEVAIAALSPAVAEAAGAGWAALAVAAIPDDRALLAAAAGLCDGHDQFGEGEA